MNYTEHEIRAAVELMMSKDEANHSVFFCLDDDVKFAAVEMFVNGYLEKLPYELEIRYVFKTEIIRIKSKTYLCLGHCLENNISGDFFIYEDNYKYNSSIFVEVFSKYGIIDLIYQLIKINS